MPGILHVEVVEQAAGALQLRLWRDNPDEPRTHPVAPAEIADLIRTAEASYYGPAATDLRQVGQRLFRWLDGGEHRLAAEIEAAAYGTDVLVLAIAMPHGLAHLPWEVLHDGTGFLVHALNPAVLPVRWRPAAPGATPPANRPLQLLFMASSPEDVRSVLDYEREEHEILTATRRWPLDLTVEESGCLEELGELVLDYGKGFFDVLHLVGHADHANDGTPVFFLEDAEGRRAPTTAVDLARTLPHRLPLVFLSGCRTGQNAAYGEVRSLAEQLVGHGFRTVLGWGSPVRDRDATLAARHLYQQLSAGVPLVPALVRAHALLREDGVRDWHLLRLFCAGEPPGAFVTPRRAPHRPYLVVRPAEFEFLDPLTRTVKVATRAGFVGRRRLLQASIRTLRLPEAPRVGRLLHGQGGRGKSSVAARLCERLRREFQRVVVVGRLDEPALVNAWARELLDDDVRRALRDPAIELLFRIEATLRRLAAAGHPAPLFVLDDFEQNQPGAADGDLEMTPYAQSVLLALVEALDHTGVGRVLITGRYALPPPFDLFLEPEELLPLDATEQQKQLLRLEQRAPPTTRGAGGLLDEAVLAADGNPRLFEWLHSVLRQPGLDLAAILEELRQAEERFREDILARRLIASLPEETRVLLGRLLMLNAPVPLAAVRVLAPAPDDAALRRMLGHAADLGLLDISHDDGEPHYRVPGQLNGGDPPLLPELGDAEAEALSGALFEVLHPLWWTDAGEPHEKRVVDLIQLGVTGERKDDLVTLGSWLATRLNGQYRYREARWLLEEAVIESAGRHHALLLNLARARDALGDAEAAGELFEEALARCPPDDEEARSTILFHLSTWLVQRGRLDDALRRLQEKLSIDEHLHKTSFARRPST
jgi:hypothetical protein